MKKFYVDIISLFGEKEICEIDFVKNAEVVLTVSSKSFGELCFTGENLFVTLSQFRMLLELKNYRLLCNAARVDAFPSRMALEMGGGRKLYLQKLGVPAKREDLVDVFGAATIEQVGTILEQNNYHEKWIMSLK